MLQDFQHEVSLSPDRNSVLFVTVEALKGGWIFDIIGQHVLVLLTYRLTVPGKYFTME